MRSILDVAAGASRRQMRIARDREVQRCRDDMLSSDSQLNAIARKRLDEVDRAFDYLTDPKKFRDFHELVNDKLRLGTVDPGSLIAKITNQEAGDGKETESSDADKNGDETSAGSESGGTSSMGLAEEHQILRELRQKRLARAPKVGKKRREAMEKLMKETIQSIEQSATSAAHAKAIELIAKGVTDSNQFYEQVYSSALEKTREVRNQALARIQENDLPVEETLIDEWETAVLDKSEAAAEREYNDLEGIMATSKVQPGKAGGNTMKFIVTLVLVAAALCVFCNINTLLTANRLDPASESAGTTSNTKVVTPTPVATDVKTGISSVRMIACGERLAFPAGSAGVAGFASNLSITGAADYNAGMHAIADGDLGGAVNAFNTAVEKNPDIYQYYYSRGCTYLFLNHLPAAVADFETARNLRTDLMQAHYNKGIVYLFDASNSATAAYLKNPYQPNKSLLSRATVNLRAAILEFDAALAKSPNLSQAFYNRGLARYRLGDMKGARDDFDKALQNDPTMEAARFNMAIVEEMLPKQGDGRTNISTKLPPAPPGPQGPPGPGVF